MSNIILNDNGILTNKKIFDKWKKQLNTVGAIYIYAMTGFGKTQVSRVFAEKYYPGYGHFSVLSETFIDDVKNYIDENKGKKPLIVIDDLSLAESGGRQNEIMNFVTSLFGDKELYVMLLSRSSLPKELKPFHITRLLEVNDKEDLKLNLEGLTLALRDFMPELQIKKFYEFTKGFPIAVRLFKNCISVGESHEIILGELKKEFFQYLDETLLKQWNEDIKYGIFKLAVSDKIDVNLADRILGEGKGKIAIDNFLEIGSFLDKTADGGYLINDLFYEYLELRQRRILGDEYSDTYAEAGSYFEEKRRLPEALRCYSKAGELDRLAKVLIYMLENADGCSFARIAAKYMELIPEESYSSELLGARIMLLSYQMKLEESRAELEKLKSIADDEMKAGNYQDAFRVYVRTFIALPNASPKEFLSKAKYFAGYGVKFGVKIRNLMPSGNMPSLLNGGLDFSRWMKGDKFLYPVLDKLLFLLIDSEAAGLADTCFGENLYEKNRSAEAISYLTRGLSDANYRGTIATQYAATGVMARLFTAEGNSDTAVEILNNMELKASDNGYYEMLPNIHASILRIKLVQGEMEAADLWLASKEAPDEFSEFYTTDRYLLMTKARVYIAKGLYTEALLILEKLLEYALKYSRSYTEKEICILKAIIAYRIDKPWQKELLRAVREGEKLDLVRIFADEGAALLPLWKEMDWESRSMSPAYIKTISRELKRMAKLYPAYLNAKDGAQAVKLSEHEVRVLGLIGRGMSNPEIASELNISISTVKYHVANLLRKLEVKNRAAAWKRAKELNVI